MKQCSEMMRKDDERDSMERLERLKGWRAAASNAQTADFEAVHSVLVLTQYWALRLGSMRISLQQGSDGN